MIASMEQLRMIKVRLAVAVEGLCLLACVMSACMHVMSSCMHVMFACMHVMSACMHVSTVVDGSAGPPVLLQQQAALHVCTTPALTADTVTVCRQTG